MRSASPESSQKLRKHSLAWMELDTVLAKLHWKYDLTLLNPEMDWQRDSRMQTLWKKPELRVRVSPRAGI